MIRLQGLELPSALVCINEDRLFSCHMMSLVTSRAFQSPWCNGRFAKCPATNAILIDPGWLVVATAQEYSLKLGNSKRPHPTSPYMVVYIGNDTRITLNWEFK